MINLTEFKSDKKNNKSKKNKLDNSEINNSNKQMNKTNKELAEHHQTSASEIKFRKNTEKEEQRDKKHRLLNNLFDTVCVLALLGGAWYVNQKTLYSKNDPSVRQAEQQKKEIHQEKKKYKKITDLKNSRKNALNNYKMAHGYLSRSIVDKYGRPDRVYIITDLETGIEYYYQNPYIKTSSELISDKNKSISALKSDKKKQEPKHILLQVRLNTDKQPIINSNWLYNQKKKLKYKLSSSTITDIKSELKNMNYHGSILLYKNGKTALNWYYNQGKINKQDNRSFLINSVQKNMTAALIIKAIQQHKLTLNDRLSKFYPHVAGASDIKISNLINMSSGLNISDEKMSLYSKGNEQDSIESISKHITFDKSKLNLNQYSSINYVLLAGILQKIYHKSYKELFTSEFINRLNLKYTSFEKNKPGFNAEDGHINGINQSGDNSALDGIIGAGNVYMSNHDLLKTELLILNQYKNTAAGKAVWNSKAISKYAGGFYNLSDTKISNGAGNGYYTTVIIDKDSKYALVMQTNYTNGHFTEFKSDARKIYKILEKSDLLNSTDFKSEIKKINEMR